MTFKIDLRGMTISLFNCYVLLQKNTVFTLVSKENAIEMLYKTIEFSKTIPMTFFTSKVQKIPFYFIQTTRIF